MVYTDFQSPILNQLYDILAELQAQDKRSHCAKYLHTWKIKETKNRTKHQKNLHYIEYYLKIRRARKSEWQKELENSSCKLHYRESSIYEGVPFLDRYVNQIRRKFKIYINKRHQMT